MSFAILPNLRSSFSRVFGWFEIQNITASLANDSNRAGDWFGTWLSIDRNAETIVVGAMLDEQNGVQAGSAYVYRKEENVYKEIQKLTATDSIQSYDQFGQTLQVSRDATKIAIAAQWDDQKATNAGAIYIFETGSSGYTQTQKVTASFGTTLSGARLGHRGIVFSDDASLIIVGAASQAISGIADSGVVYIFKSGSSGYSQIQSISAPTTGIGFGYSVSINSDATTLAVGAVTDSTQAFYGGSAFIYTSSSAGYQYSQKLTPSGDTSRVGDVFGAFVNLSRDGKTLAISATYEDQGITTTGINGFAGEAGAVYIFSSGSLGYSQEQKLTQTGDSQPYNDHFGYVTMFTEDGKKLIIGSETDDENGVRAGSAYLFVSSSDGFKRQHKFMAENDSSPDGDYYGVITNISADGNTVVVSAIYDEDAGVEAGSVYIYQYK